MTQVTVTLVPDERSPAMARRVVRQVLGEAQLPHLLDDVLLLVTELVTNAAVHAGTAFQLDIDASPPGLRVEVTDHSPGAFPVLRPKAEEEREGGRGLFLMDALAVRWGTTHFASGKSVWFELDRTVPTGPVASPPTLGSVDAAPDVDWLLGLPAHLERQLSEQRLQGELVHRLGDVLGSEEVWLASAEGRSTRWVLAATRGAVLEPEELESQRRLVVAATEPVLRTDGDLLVVLAGPNGALGVLGVRGGAALEPPQVALVRLVGQRLLLSLGDAEAAASRSRERGSLALLAEASDMFAGQLDVQLAAALAAQLVVPRFAKWSAVYTTLDGGPKLAAVAHSDEEQLTALRTGLEDDAGRRFARDLLKGLEQQAPVFLPATDLPPGVDAATAGQVLALPLVARRRLLGALLVVRPAEDAYAAQDVGVLLDLARRAALAIDNARLYQERTAIAQALQAWLLPPELPSAPELDVGARYVAAGAGNEVGGDFYDVFRLADGGWGVAIGDVCGKGAEAAAITGLARDVLRLLLRRGTAPAQALRELNDAILELGERGRFCTAAAATLHVEGDALVVCLSVAGHPAPVRVAAGVTELVGAGGSLLGVMPDVELEDAQLRLEAGDGLVFYTDGVTERRRGPLMLGEEGLLRILRRAHGLSADAVAGLVEREVTAFAREASRDDLALLVVRATGNPPD